MIIGIDFGTRFSCVAFMNGLIPVTDYINDPNKTGIPTIFMYSRNLNKELYGYECLSAEAAMNSADVIQNMKRTIRENPNNLNATVMSGGKNYTIKDIVRKYLMYLIAQAKSAAIQSGEFSNTNIEWVTITVPVGIAEGQMTATDYNKLLVDTITEITGLSENKVSVLEEPVSAAISYLYSENIRKEYSNKQTILVFDLGGGTLDVTIVEHNPTTMEYAIKAKEGDLKLGGNNWDEALSNAVLSKVGISGSFGAAEEESRFKNSIIRLKHDLTGNEESIVVFKYNGSTKFADFTRLEFERTTKNLLDRAIAVTKKTISSFSGGLSGIDKIILVGGSSNMPQIRKRMLTEFALLGEVNIVTHDPSKAIAKGAAIYAIKLSFNPNPNVTVTGGVGAVRDIATHTYGFNSRRSSDGKNMIYNLLFKGTKFDSAGKIVVKSDTSFVACEDSQTKVSWTVYESNEKKRTGDNANWMEYGSNENQNGMKVTVAIPPEYLGKASQYPCWVTFSLDQRTGILEIIVTDRDGKRVGYDKKQV